MAPFYSFSPKSTSISFPWPPGVTGIERIMLSAQGDLQRVISAFFARPITIAVAFTHTYGQLAPGLAPFPMSLPNSDVLATVSVECPITQTRRVHLQCADKVVCTATSNVRITSARCARLFLEDKYPIGQMFRKLEKLPQFELLEVGFGFPYETSSKHKEPLDQSQGGQLWRRYKLTVPEFECEILEEFPSRDMFTFGEDWLLDRHPVEQQQTPSHTIEAELGLPQFSLNIPRWQGSLLFLFALGFFLMLFLEILMFLGGRESTC